MACISISSLFARAQYLTLFKTRFSFRRWGYVLFFTPLYG